MTAWCKSRVIGTSSAVRRLWGVWSSQILPMRGSTARSHQQPHAPHVTRRGAQVVRINVTALNQQVYAARDIACAQARHVFPDHPGANVLLGGGLVFLRRGQRHAAWLLN